MSKKYRWTPVFDSEKCPLILQYARSYEECIKLAHELITMQEIDTNTTVYFWGLDKDVSINKFDLLLKDSHDAIIQIFELKEVTQEESETEKLEHSEKFVTDLLDRVVEIVSAFKSLNIEIVVNDNNPKKAILYIPIEYVSEFVKFYLQYKIVDPSYELNLTFQDEEYAELHNAKSFMDSLLGRYSDYAIKIILLWN